MALTRVSRALLADDSVNSDKVADSSINSEHFVDGGIDTVHIADDAVTADKLANSINSEIAANTAKVTNATHTGDVTGATALTIANDAVTTAKILDANVTTAKIAADAITGAKIADDAINSEHYTDGSIDTVHIADNNITHDKLENRYTASGSITTYTGAVSVDWSSATNYVMGSAITGAIEFDFTGFKTGQVLTIHNLTGSYAITLDSDAATSEQFNKLGENDYDGSATNALMIECIDDDATAVFNYSVLTYTADTTP